MPVGVKGNPDAPAAAHAGAVSGWEQVACAKQCKSTGNGAGSSPISKRCAASSCCARVLRLLDPGMLRGARWQGRSMLAGVLWAHVVAAARLNSKHVHGCAG